jgi:hypothetical protein
MYTKYSRCSFAKGLSTRQGGLKWMAIRGKEKHLNGEWTQSRKKTGQVAEDCSFLSFSDF